MCVYVGGGLPREAIRSGRVVVVVIVLFFGPRWGGVVGGGLLEGSVEEGDGCDGVGVGYCVVMLVRGQ